MIQKPLFLRNSLGRSPPGGSRAKFSKDKNGLAIYRLNLGIPSSETYAAVFQATLEVDLVADVVTLTVASSAENPTVILRRVAVNQFGVVTSGVIPKASRIDMLSVEPGQAIRLEVDDVIELGTCSKSQGRTRMAHHPTPI